MKKVIYKIGRTLQVNFPAMQDLKFMVKRTYRGLFKVPCELDFHALGLLKNVDSMLFVDAGANRGETIQAIKMKAGKARIVAFEPNPIVFKKLQGTYGKDQSIQLMNTGLGDHPDKLELNIPFYKNFMFDGLASFSEHEALNWLRSRIYFFREADLKLKKVSCKIEELDDYNLNPDFIKIDVQGFELKVLMGSKKTIDRSNPVLLIETPTEDVTQYLQSINYSPFRYNQEKDGLESGHGRLNTFFFRPEKLSLIQSK